MLFTHNCDSLALLVSCEIRFWLTGEKGTFKWFLSLPILNRMDQEICFYYLDIVKTSRGIQ